MKKKMTHSIDIGVFTGRRQCAYYRLSTHMGDHSPNKDMFCSGRSWQLYTGPICFTNNTEKLNT